MVEERINEQWAHPGNIGREGARSVFKVYSRCNFARILAVTILLFLCSILQWIAKESPTNQIVIQFFVFGVMLPVTVYARFVFNVWAYRKYGARYRMTDRGICRWWGSLKASSSWQSLVAYCVYPVQESGAFYQISLFTYDWYKDPFRIYVDRNQLPHVMRVLEGQGLEEVFADGNTGSVSIT